jgi:D-3-phosphoglycerate dehydrogenase
MKIDIFVIDFDSTFVDRESVNLLLELAIKGHPRRADMANKLKILADLCMKSEVGFQEYFRMRIEIVKQALKEEHLLQVAEILKDKVSPDIIKLLDLVKKLGKKVIVISNSFKLIMKNLMEQYGIEIYFANKHIADKHGFIVGFDESNPLANDNGK